MDSANSINGMIYANKQARLGRCACDAERMFALSEEGLVYLPRLL